MAAVHFGEANCHGCLLSSRLWLLAVIDIAIGIAVDSVVGIADNDDGVVVCAKMPRRCQGGWEVGRGVKEMQ